MCEVVCSALSRSVCVSLSFVGVSFPLYVSLLPLWERVTVFRPSVGPSSPLLAKSRRGSVFCLSACLSVYLSPVGVFLSPSVSLALSHLPTPR
jgi:hypothetical protein